MLNILSVILSFCLLVYSVPLGIAFMAYAVISSVYTPRKLLIADIIVFMGLLLYTYYKRDLIDIPAIIHQPQYIWQTYKQGLMLGLRTDWHSWHQVYTHGLFSVLLIAMLLKCIFSYLNYRSVTINLKIRDLEKQQAHEELLANGTLLSKSYGEDIVITDKELNQHCLIIGTTGAGKTTTILNIVDSAASRKLPCIYLDGKGSPELVDKLRIIATKHNRTLKVFTLRPNMNIPETAYYNPFSSGTATEWKNRIMSLFAEAQGKGQEHFSLAEQNYINFVSNVLHGLSQKENQSIDLKILLTFLENRDLLIAAANKVDPVMAAKLDNLHNDANNKHMAADVVKLLELFIYSSWGCSRKP